MVENPYLQFPLCALSFGQTVDARLNAILDYSIVEAGGKMFRKLNAEQQSEFLRGKTVSQTNPGGILTDDWRQTAASYGAEMIGVKYHHIHYPLENHGQLRDYVAAFESLHGGDARVRLKKSWLFDARDGHGLTYREFSVLCAIYSVIGNKELARITRDRIRRCALGYRSPAIMQAELPHRQDQAQPLTERELRDTIARLHRNKFFARCTVGRRVTYYSIRLDPEAFRKKILERRTYPAFFHASQAAQDQVLTDAIKQRRQEAVTSEPKPAPLPPRIRFTPPEDSR